MTDDLPPLPPLRLGHYRHYKGGEYDVVAAARHSESLSPMVVYKPLYGDRGWWVRPLDMFLEQVQADGQWQPRFAHLGPTDSRAPTSRIGPPAAELAVVPMTAARAESFRDCLDTVAREKRFLAQVQAPPLDQVRQFVNGVIEKDAVQFVALDGERVVGWADILPDWAHALAHRGHLGMGVLPEYRGRGLGTRLLSACIAKATAKGLTRIELETRIDNTAAIGLYRKSGFIEEGRKRRGMRIDGTYFDTIAMARLSDGAA